MKDKIDLRMVGTLLRKSGRERSAAFKQRNFDLFGFFLRLVLIAAIVALFVLFFGRFCDVYLAVRTAGKPDPVSRGDELLTILYSAVILGMTVSCVTQIGRELFKSDDIRLYSALPIGAKTLFLAKLISIYCGQVVISTVVVLAVNLPYGLRVQADASFWAATAGLCFLLPFISIALGAFFAIPYQAAKRFLKDRFVVLFILLTALLGLLFWAYAFVLRAAKDLLLGDSLRYFFNDRVISGIGKAVSCLYPARWIGRLLTGTRVAESWAFLLGFSAVFFGLSLFVIRFLLVRSLQERNEGSHRYLRRSGSVKPMRSRFAALLKKEFLLIFRTPSYMVSYFSVALIMPLMVYFCTDVTSSLVSDLIGLECDLELALFLTILFGALTNVFCGTNISRDGEGFYLVKAMPVDYREVFFSKILLCLIVTEISQIASAVLLFATGLVAWYDALFLLLVGSVFGLVYICAATRYDFDHAHFSAEEDGEIGESGGTVSVIVVLGLAIALVVGGLLFVLKILEQLRRFEMGWLTYLLAAAMAVIALGASLFYLLFRLGKKYRMFTGGGQ